MNNYVKKNMDKLHKPAVHKNKKYNAKNNITKHKGNKYDW